VCCTIYEKYHCQILVLKQDEIVEWRYKIK
jgi:hypothetical protein